MIRKAINEWLSAVYKLPVVEFFNETITEKTVSYDLTTSPILVRPTGEGNIRFEFNIDVLYRCPNGEAGIGFLTLGLADTSNRPPSFNLVSAQGQESITYQTKTEMIISKTLTGFVEVQANQARELLKCVEFEDGLECNKCQIN